MLVVLDRIHLRCRHPHAEEDLEKGREERAAKPGEELDDLDEIAAERREDHLPRDLLVRVQVLLARDVELSVAAFDEIEQHNEPACELSHVDATTYVARGVQKQRKIGARSVCVARRKSTLVDLSKAISQHPAHPALHTNVVHVNQRVIKHDPQPLVDRQDARVPRLRRQRARPVRDSRCCRMRQRKAGGQRMHYV